MTARLTFYALIAMLTAGCSGMGMAPSGASSAQMIVLRQTAKSPEDVVAAIEAYAKAKQWVYFGALTVRPPQGAVTMVKVCIPAVGAALWPLGLELSAILPCGNFGAYRKDGQTQVSMLDPRYMFVLVPRPEVEKASELARTQFSDLLESVVR